MTLLIVSFTSLFGQPFKAALFAVPALAQGLRQG
jgi:hypothetical protein